MTGLVMGLACLGVLYFLLESNLAASTIEPGSDFENFELNETTLDMIQTNTTESLHDIYYQIKVGNTIRPIMISSYENLVSNINYDSEEKSIVLVISSLNAKADNLVIDIPRIILDSKANGIDKNFTVMVDDQPARFLELSNSNEEKRISNSITNSTSATQLSNNTDSRKLIVEFEPNTKIIKISGTDTTNSNNQSKTENKKSNLIVEGDKGSIDTVFPIVFAIAISGSVLLYYFYRKNKLPRFKKLQRQNR